MEFQVTRHFGTYQFWHVGCPQSRAGSPMHAPIELDNDIKQFKCAGCGQVGRGTLPIITVGQGTLEPVKGKAMSLTQGQTELFHHVHGRIQDDSKGITVAEYEQAINAAFLMAQKSESRIAELEKAVEEEIGNRDAWEERASKLAYAVGDHFGESVGEHSSANCPINNAHELLNQVR